MPKDRPCISHQNEWATVPQCLLLHQESQCCICALSCDSEANKRTASLWAVPISSRVTENNLNRCFTCRLTSMHILDRESSAGIIVALPLRELPMCSCHSIQVLRPPAKASIPLALLLCCSYGASPRRQRRRGKPRRFRCNCMCKQPEARYLGYCGPNLMPHGGGGSDSDRGSEARTCSLLNDSTLEAEALWQKLWRKFASGRAAGTSASWKPHTLIPFIVTLQQLLHGTQAAPTADY